MKHRTMSSDDELKRKIDEFVQVAEQLPERYRVACFEVLLDAYLRRREPASQESITKEAVVLPTSRYAFPIDVKAFLNQYKVPEESVGNLFLFEGAEIRPIFQIKNKEVKADAQIQVALLAALENALKPDGKFEFSVETVRRTCIDQGVYDSGNFMTYFKNSSKLFKSLKDKEHVELSPDGKTELAEAISAVLE
jgi:hypothetical protein